MEINILSLTVRMSTSDPPPHTHTTPQIIHSVPHPVGWRLSASLFFTPRLREAVEAKRGVLPRFGSKYRYSGRTLYETRVNTEQRTQPYFERTASKQYINNNRTRSMDDSELTALKGTHDEDPSWAESIENVPMFPCAGFVQWFCQKFCDRSTFSLWIWAPRWPWGMAMLVRSLLMKIRKGLVT